MCYFRTRNENGDDAGNETTFGKALLFQETGKKSSYLLQRKEGQSLETMDANETIAWYSIPKPAHVVVEHDKHTATSTDSKKDRTFFFGGLQLVFDAKNVEIYLTSPEGKETYLMTSKGIPYKMNDEGSISKESESRERKVEWRRALCVVPGGPRCISSVRINLIGDTSKAASTSNTINVRYLKLTARIVNNQSPSSNMPSKIKLPSKTNNPPQIGKTSNPFMVAPAMSTTNPTSSSEPPLTQKDLGAAMAGLSFMARKTEENMSDLLEKQSKNIEKHLASYFTRIEMQMHALKPTLVMQHQLIKENQIMMKEQQQIIEYQTTQINKLLNDNQDLQVRVQSLQADVSILRSQVSDSNTGEENSCYIQNAETSESKTTAKTSSFKSISPSDNAPSSLVLRSKEIDIKMENAHLRKVIKNIARGIDEEPLLGGCGGTTGMHPGSMEDTVMNVENKSHHHAESREKVKTNTNPIDLEKVVREATKEIEDIPFSGGCGSILHGIEGEIMRKIDSVISSGINPSAVSLDTTRSLKNKQKKYSDEVYNHTSNIEVTLLQDEQTEAEVVEANDEGEVPTDGKIDAQTRLM
jgi:hypothetical protein